MKTKFCYIDNITSLKEKVIINKAFQLRLVKNYISEIIYNNFYEYKDKSKQDLIVEFAKQIHIPNLTQKSVSQVNYFLNKSNNLTTELPKLDIEYAIVEVFTTYKNKSALIKSNLKFKIIKNIKLEYYKKNTKNNKKGDLKTFKINFKSSKLSKVLSNISKSISKQQTLEEYIIYLNKVIKSNEYSSNVIDFYKNIIFYINKFGFNRINNLINLKQKNILKIYNKNKHIFNSLSFSSESRIKIDIIKENNNKNSKIDAFISIGGFYELKTLRQSINKEIKSNSILHIPIKLNNKYHTNQLNDFVKSYTIQFDDFGNIKRINITKIIEEKVNKIRSNNSKNRVIGGDINIKNNFITTSDKRINIDFDRRLLGKYFEFLKKNIDNRAKSPEGKTLILDEKIKRKYDLWKVRIENMIIEKVVHFVKQSKKFNYNHIILEDLELIGSFRAKNKEFNTNYGRLSKILNLTSLKHKIISIVHKHGLNVSFVQPDYSSQNCVCGSIKRANRIIQENFKCVDCNFIQNADEHSAYMIKDRGVSAVLSFELLVINEFNEFRPKKLKQVIIKQKLEQHYSKVNKLSF